MKDLIFTVKSMVPMGKHDVEFIIDIVDEYTLQQLEKRYPGKLQFDGSRTYTLRTVAPIRGMDQLTPEMWEEMKRDKPEIIQAFVLERLKGNI